VRYKKLNTTNNNHLAIFLKLHRREKFWKSKVLQKITQELGENS
jgi:hypothetical protein